MRSCQSPTWIWLVNYLHLHLHSHLNLHCGYVYTDQRCGHLLMLHKSPGDLPMHIDSHRRLKLSPCNTSTANSRNERLHAHPPPAILYLHLSTCTGVRTVRERSLYVGDADLVQLQLSSCPCACAGRPVGIDNAGHGYTIRRQQRAWLNLSDAQRQSTSLERCRHQHFLVQPERVAGATARMHTRLRRSTVIDVTAGTRAALHHSCSAAQTRTRTAAHTSMYTNPATSRCLHVISCS